MAVSLNKVILAGNLTRDPQVRFLANEQAVANFGIAINRRYKGGDGQMREEATFVDVEAWGRTADLVGQYLTKGRSVFIEGRLKLDQWDDKDGQKRSKLKIVADNVQFLDSGKRDESAGPVEHHAAKPYDSQANRAGDKPAPAAADGEPPW